MHAGAKSVRIAEADIRNHDLFERILAVQIASYEIESKLIEYPDFPPLRQTVKDLQESGERFFFCLVNEEVAGAISYALLGDVADICRLVVSPAHFGKGIGTRLVRRVEQEISEPVKRIIVSTAWRNTPAIRLYEKCGYNVYRRWFLPDGLELVGLEKYVHA